MSSHSEKELHETLPEPTYYYEKVLAKRSYEKGLQYDLTPEGFYPESIEQVKLCAKVESMIVHIIVTEND